VPLSDLWSDKKYPSLSNGYIQNKLLCSFKLN
jgi:hypothetical protein